MYVRLSTLESAIIRLTKAFIRRNQVDVEFEEIKKKLTQRSVGREEYPQDRYHDHLFEQYKLCIEMADRISQRRNLANTLFLTLNTGVLAALATMFEKGSDSFLSQAILVIALICLTASCVAWRTLIGSYRQLNTAKYKVIGAYEELLPSSPYYNAEWWALGEGKDKTKYTQLSLVESYVPAGLAIAYLVMIGVVVFQEQIVTLLRTVCS